MKNWLATCLVGAFALALPGVAQAQKTKVTIYTALENDQLGPFKASIEKAVPDADVVWVRDSTGVITARFLAEKDNPRADMVMGLAASSLLMFEKAGLLEAYKPAGADALKPVFRDGNEPYTWTCMDAYLGVVCFNTVEAKGVAVPTSWKDLLNPALKGKIVMPHPASSGTGYLMVAGWLQSLGEAEGWKFMDGLHENIAQYTHSGSRPCNMAGAGEYVLGISFEYRANSNKAKGAPIDLVFPKEGLGWDLEAFGIHKGTKKLDAAKKLADWASSKDAMILYGKNFAITAQPGVAPPLPNVPKDYESRLVKKDFYWEADNRERILAEWTRRYNAKSEPRR